jgi:hypothetical protein
MGHKKHNRSKNAHTKADRFNAEMCKAQGRMVGRTFRDHKRRLCRNVTYPDGRHIRQVHDLSTGWTDAERDPDSGEWEAVA